MTKARVQHQNPDDPDRDILTPQGALKLLVIGDKALAQLINQGLPHVPCSNSYRMSRRQVIEWIEDEGIRHAKRPPGLLTMEDGEPSESDGD